MLILTSTSYASRSDFQLSSRCSCSKIDDSTACECLGLRRRARSSSAQKRPLFRAESLTFPLEEHASKSWAKCQFLNGLCFYTAGSRRIAAWFGRRERVSACYSDRLQSSVTFEACSGFTRVTARRIAQPPKATFITRLRPFRSPGRAARQLPDQSTTLRVESSSTGDPRLRGALPLPTFWQHRFATSDLAPIPDIDRGRRHVREVPRTEVERLSGP
jgi:hypothetical protein